MHILKALPTALFLLASPMAFAQDTSDGGEEGDGAPNPLELSMGEPDIAVGDIYLEGEFTDWEIRCIKTEDGRDPCQLYQLLDDGQGNPVAEINVFPIFGDDGPVVGATVITPLETLLTQQLGLSVDGGAQRKYPFSWCSPIGCFSRMGFTEAEVQQFRAGNQANLVIVPVAAPDQRISLSVSLSGFTAGLAELTTMMEALQSAGE